MEYSQYTFRFQECSVARAAIHMYRVDSTLLHQDIHHLLETAINRHHKPDV